MRLNRWFALAGDVTTLLDRRTNEDPAWGAGLQIAIPYSPHTLSLQVTNTNTATLQGASRGIDKVRGGFEFTIPFTFSRYFGKKHETAQTGAAGVVTGPVVNSEMRTMAFGPKRLEIAAALSSVVASRAAVLVESDTMTCARGRCLAIHSRHCASA